MRRTTRGERLRRDAEVDEAGTGDRDRGDRRRFGSRATMRSAISRGLRLATRARARATGLAKSPWPSPRLRSTGISGRGSRAGSPSSRSAASACARSDRMCSFTGRILRGSPGWRPHASAWPRRAGPETGTRTCRRRGEGAHSNPPCQPVCEAGSGSVTERRRRGSRLAPTGGGSEYPKTRRYGVQQGDTRPHRLRIGARHAPVNDIVLNDVGLAIVYRWRVVGGMWRRALSSPSPHAPFDLHFAEHSCKAV